MTSGDAKSWQPGKAPWNSLVLISLVLTLSGSAGSVCVQSGALIPLGLQSCAGLAPGAGMVLWRAALFKGKDRSGRHCGSGGSTWDVSKCVLGWVISESRLRALLRAV